MRETKGNLLGTNKNQATVLGHRHKGMRRVTNANVLKLTGLVHEPIRSVSYTIVLANVIEGIRADGLCIIQVNGVIVRIGQEEGTILNMSLSSTPNTSETQIL